MNPKATSRKEILAACRGIVRESGLSGISIRSAAAAAGVAPTTIYNYFPSKDALLLSVTGDIWADIFDLGDRTPVRQGFADYVDAVFSGARERLEGYPGFVSGHALSLMSEEGDTSEGKRRMLDFFRLIDLRLEEALATDSAVRGDAFGERLGREAFCGLVRDQLLLELIMGRRDCSALLGVVRAILY